MTIILIVVAVLIGIAVFGNLYATIMDVGRGRKGRLLSKIRY